jgi:hypothetical protein
MDEVEWFLAGYVYRVYIHLTEEERKEMSEEIQAIADKYSCRFKVS